MQKASLIVLKKILSSLPSPKQEKLLFFLSSNDKKIYSSLLSFEDKLVLEDISLDNLIDYVHYSWFLPTLQTYSKKEISLFISAFSPSSQKSLLQLLDITLTKAKVTATGRKFLRDHLLASLIGEKKQLLNISYLPQSPLNQLLKLTKKDLIRLIDFLGLYDLLKELRQIVDPKLLKKVQSCLSKEKLLFLKSIKNLKEPFSLPKNSLSHWDNNKKTLLSLTHKAGLIRLSKALCNENENLIWYIVHFLDIGRGTTLMKLCEIKEKAFVSSFISKQITNVIQTILLK